MNITEPQAGSDLAAIRTKAVPEGDHYRISGTKIFITWGEHDMAAEHRPPRAGAPAGCTAGREGHLAVPVPEVPGQCRRLARRAQRPRVRVDRTQAGHPRQCHRGDVVRRGRGRHRLAGRRAEPGPGLHVHDDEPRAPERRARRRGHLGARLPAGPPVRARPRAGQDARSRGRTERDHHRPPRRAPHADGHEGARRGDARAGLLHGRPDGPGPWPQDQCDAAERADAASTC